MQVSIDYGCERLEVNVEPDRLVRVHQQPQAPPLEDPVAAVRGALETPIGFPALRRALTPDDQVAVVLDEHVPCLPELLSPVLQHLTEARVALEAITLVCPPTQISQNWVERLPAEFRHVRVEVHDPTDRRRLSYLATTGKGRRIYLNRRVVDADQLVLVTQRSFDPLLGYSGSEGALYPTLSDEATLKEMGGLLSMKVPGEKPWPARQEAAEVAWLLGAPFVVHLIAGAGQAITHVLAGLVDTGEEAVRLLNARWRLTVDGLADVVVAGVCGDPDAHGFSVLSEALACAARVVKPQGRIVLLTAAKPVLGAASELLRQAEDPTQALGLLRRHGSSGMAAAFQWASAAQRATVYLLSRLPDETAEELFTVPLEHAGQVQRLLDSAPACLFLSDAQKSLAVASNSHAD
ncbi:MAG TPA: lactate racemase domain-containing protein [Gemmataceae bacterium]|nr:lactate racemase domain-containing protein [Gemmataceae bacterium]